MQQKANNTIRLQHRQDRISLGIARRYAAAIRALSDASSPHQAHDGIIGGSWYSDRGYDGDDDRESYDTILLTSLSRIKRWNGSLGEGIKSKCW